jgi:hypothetical protein
MKRSLFPPSCNFEVALDLKNYNFFDDRYNTSIEFSTEVEEEEFIPAIRFEPSAEYYKTNYPSNPLSRYGSRFFSLESWNIKPGIAYKISIDPFFSKEDCKFSKTVEFNLPAKN